MFLAPCTLPMVPGYLAFIAGVPATGPAHVGRAARRRVLWNALAFVLGFSLIFIVLGVSASTLGALLGPWRQGLGRAAGVLIILFGLTMLGVVTIPVISSERRSRIPNFLTIGRVESSFLIGILFALGWSPCVGPILGTILLFAGTAATALQGALLLAIFSLGLGLPFLATALLLREAGELFTRWSGRLRVLSLFGGVLLVLLGVVMLLGGMGELADFGYRLFGMFGYDRLLNYL